MSTSLVLLGDGHRTRGHERIGESGRERERRKRKKKEERRRTETKEC